MKLVFAKEFQRFHDYINYPENDRIIFSAPFGIGKTTFLKDYFSNHPEYEVFHLFPANYSVSENDNIFEYIKYDILYQIINKTEIEKVGLNHNLTFWSFIAENEDKIVKPFIEGISMLNKPIAALLKTVQGYNKLGIDYLKYHENIQDVDLKKINDFRCKEENRTGSIYEHNFITQLIQYYLAKISKPIDQGLGKKSVLIIDDLDRIDPDHFFRILNIFAAHIDQISPENELKNKFGFDQVLFVFDKDNARNIFHYRYGPKVDYNGYINKFYSRTIFEFDPFPDINDKLIELLNRIQISGIKKGLFNFSDNSNLYTGFILHIIKAMLINRQINLRNLIKLLDRELLLQIRSLNLPNNNNRLKNINFIIITIFDLLIELLGETGSLDKALKESSKSSDFWSDFHTKFYLLQHLISLLDYKEHDFIGKQGAFKIKVDDQEFHYNLINSPNTVWARLNDDKGYEVDPMTLFNQINSININRLIYRAYLICKDLGIYK